MKATWKADPMSFETGLPARPATESVPAQTDIARRSFQIWEREGRPNGRHVIHWRMAEAELASGVLRRQPALAPEQVRDVYFWDLIG